MNWSIKREDTLVEKGTKEWLVDDNAITITLENQGTDICLITTCEGFDDEPQWPVETYLSVWEIKDDGTRVRHFYGRVDRIKRIGTEGTEAITYQIVGPWWHLENLTYQRFWNVLKNPLDPSEGLVQMRTSHVFLHLDDLGFKYAASAQLSAVIAYSQNPKGGPVAVPGPPDGAPIAGWVIEGLSALEEPIEDVKDMKCAEIIRRCLRYAPDSVVWFNYNNGLDWPTLHIARRDNLAAVQIDQSQEIIEGIEMEPRNDLQVSGVEIIYERTNTVNGIANLRLSRRAYPLDITGGEFKCVNATINLEGSTFNYTSATILTAIPPTGTGEDLTLYWKARMPYLNKVKGLVLKEIFREEGTDPVVFPRELLDGQIADWMGGTKADETFSSAASYFIVDEQGVAINKQVDDPLEHKTVVTNLNTGTYYNITEAQWEEPEPVNLERYLYEAASVLHYDGQFQLLEDDGEVSDRVSMGNVVNLSGYKEQAWATMKAMVQKITKQLNTGTVSVTIGPPKHLGMNDILELCRMSRFRMREASVNSMLYGRSTRGNSTALGSKLTKHSSNVGKGKWDRIQIGKFISIDVADNPKNKEIKLREEDVCVLVAGVYKPMKMMILGSDPY
jgi:hypothetical protein